MRKKLAPQKIYSSANLTIRVWNGLNNGNTSLVKI